MKKLPLSDFDFELPQGRIAQKPMRPRDSSRLMVVHTKTQTIEHRHFCDIIDYLIPGDVLVLNDSKVIPARLKGHKSTGGTSEILLVRKLAPSTWSALVKNAKESDAGKMITIGITSPLHCTLMQKNSDSTWIVKFAETGAMFQRRLALHGDTPTPPYITAHSTLARYQTVYAHHHGSVAAPTAGFHFTKPLLSRLKKRGVRVTTVTLHVGPGTFLPIREDDVTKHVIHSEQGFLGARSAALINAAKKKGNRIIAVGTTSVRVLESFADSRGVLHAGEKDIDLFIYPGYRFKIVDALITNFHLPKSTLLLLVSAFAAHRTKNGCAFIQTCYAEAIHKNYRFYSFGDAMVIE